MAKEGKGVVVFKKALSELKAELKVANWQCAVTLVSPGYVREQRQAVSTYVVGVRRPPHHRTSGPPPTSDFRPGKDLKHLGPGPGTPETAQYTELALECTNPPLCSIVLQRSSCSTAVDLLWPSRQSCNQVFLDLKELAPRCSIPPLCCIVQYYSGIKFVSHSGCRTARANPSVPLYSCLAEHADLGMSAC